MIFWIEQVSGQLVDRHEIVKEKSVEELNAQLVSLVGENGGRDASKCFQK